MKNQDKITFLFGAGASANSLPVINQVPDRLNDLIITIKNQGIWLPDDQDFPTIPNKSKKQMQLEVLEHMEWLFSEIDLGKHSSVDTLAKKLYLKGERKMLARLKRALSSFFIIEQMRRPIDRRYDTFFASILNGDTKGFPQNVTILSWNYDYQFEMAYSEYSGWSELRENQDSLGIISKFSPDNIPKQAFRIIKLNGTTAFEGINSFDRIIDPLGSTKDTITPKNLEPVFYYASQGYPLLSFAWESEGVNSRIVETAVNSITDTRLLAKVIVS